MGLDGAQAQESASAIVDGRFDQPIAGDADSNRESEADDEGDRFVFEADAAGDENACPFEKKRVEPEQRGMREVEGVGGIAREEDPARDAIEFGFKQDGGLDEQETADSPLQPAEGGCDRRKREQRDRGEHTERGGDAGRQARPERNARPSQRPARNSSRSGLNSTVATGQAPVRNVPRIASPPSTMVSAMGTLRRRKSAAAKQR